MYVPKEAEAQKKRQSLNNKDLKDFNLMLYYDDVKYMSIIFTMGIFLTHSTYRVLS